MGNMDNMHKQSGYHLTAINTVAQYAGLRVDDVLRMLHIKIGNRHEIDTRLNVDGLKNQNRAINTVCQYAGLSIESVYASLAKRKQAKDESNQTVYKKAA